MRGLLQAQCPRFARHALRRLGEGWDNVTFLLGEDHAVRLPRRGAGVPLLLHEQRWLPELAAGLPLEVPLPVHLGTPAAAFPWPWSVVRWVRGTTAEGLPLGHTDVARLTDALRTLHRPAPREAPDNPFRGVPLRTRASDFEARLARLADHSTVDAARVRALWEDGASAPAAQERRWMHGDLHPRNVIVRDGRLVGLIDWGDMNGGDAATDLACAWSLVDDPGARRELLDGYGASEAEVRRARGWAAHLALGLIDSGEPRHVPLGLAALERLAKDA